MPSTAAQIDALLKPRSVDELKRNYIECRRRELAGEEFAVDARQAITRELLTRISREDVASFEGAVALMRVALMRVPQNQLNAQVRAAHERGVRSKGERQAADVDAIVARADAIAGDVDGPVSADDALKDGWGEDLGDEPPLQVGDDVDLELAAHQRVRATGLGQ